MKTRQQKVTEMLKQKKTNSRTPMVRKILDEFVYTHL